MKRPALGLIETNGLTGAIAAIQAATKAADILIASAERTGKESVTAKLEGEWDDVQAAVAAGAQAAEQAGELVALHVIPRPDEAIKRLLPYARFLARYLEEQPKAETSRPKKVTTSPRPKPKAKPRPKSAEPTTPPAPKPEPKPEPRPEPIPEPRPEPVPAPAPSIPPPAMPEPTPPKPEPTVEPQPKPEPKPQPEPEPKSDGPSWDDLERMPVVKLRRFARTIDDLPIQGRQISMANKSQLLEAIASLGRIKPEE